MVLMIGMIGVANAALECTIDTADTGPSNTSVIMVVDTTNGNPPESAMVQWTLLWATSNPPTTHQDSITASHTFPDSFALTGLHNGTKYYYQLIYQDSATTDTTAVDSVTMDNIVQTVAVYETTASSFSVSIEIAGADSAAKKLVLARKHPSAESSYVRIDSATTINNNDDSLGTTGLAHNAAYSYITIMTDSTDTDTSTAASVTTEWFDPTIYVYDTTYRQLYFRIEATNPDSALKKLVLEVLRRGIGDTVYTRIDSATTIDNNDDSLNTAQGSFELATPVLARTDQYIVWRFIGTDSTGTDTTAADSTMLDKYSMYNYYLPKGRVAGVYHDQWSWDQSQDSWTSTRYNLSEGWGARVWMKVFGEDNNRTFDSLYVITYSYTPAGDKNAVDTVIIAEMDTGTHTAAYVWYPLIEDTVFQARNGSEDWGTTFGFDATVTDSSEGNATADTMTLDTRYLDVWVEIFKK